MQAQDLKALKLLAQSNEAGKSTGPKTAAGKTAVAGNALKHGATAAPPPEKVATWLSVILEKPELSPSDFLPVDETGRCALELALAEARLAVAEEALADFTTLRLEQKGGPGKKAFGGAKLGMLVDFWLREIKEGAVSDAQAAAMKPVIERINALRGRPRGTDREYRLLRRYAAEARSRRYRALRAWLGDAGEWA